MFGIDFDEPQPAEEIDGEISCNETTSVEVPQTEIPIAQEAFHDLNRSINLLRESEFHGVDIYLEVLQFLTAFNSN